MNITMTNPDGVKLKTAKKYCQEDIDIFPILQEKTVTLNNVDVSADEGYAGLSTVHVALPEEGAKLNVEYSLTAPTDTSKIWVKRDGEPTYFTVSTNAEDQMYRYSDTSITLPKPVVYCPIVVFGGKMYIFGINNNYQNDICIVDMTDNSVSTVTKALGYKMKESKAVVLDDKIYIFCSIPGKVLTYDPQTEAITEKLAWECGSSIRMGCVVYEGCVYFIGKETMYNAQNGTRYWYCYNPVSNTITTMGDIQGLTKNWRDSAVIAYNDNLYVFGGSREDSYFRAQDAIFKYNFTTKQWTTMTATLPDVSSFLKCLTLGSKVYLFGSTQHAKYVYVFDCETETIEFLGEIFPDYYNYENVWYGNAFYRVGGGNNESLQKSIATFKVDFALPHGNVLFYEGNGGVPLKILSGQKDIEVKVKNVFIGNASGRAELIDAYYHNGTNWVNINTGATLS
mgnify:CR=1 FL=1